MQPAGTGDMHGGEGMRDDIMGAVMDGNLNAASRSHIYAAYRPYVFRLISPPV